MRIEVIRQLHPLERERYTFIVRVVANGLFIHLSSYKHEKRQSVRHRIHMPEKVWFESQNDSRAYHYVTTRCDKPKVPLEVEKELFKKFERSIHKTFDTIPT